MSSQTNKEYLKSCIENLKNDLTMQELFAKNGLDLDILELIPIKFDDLDVSAKTDHGVITINKKLFNTHEDKDILGYLCHEITHFIQQCFGDSGTKNKKNEHYLENEFEQEAFKNQIQFIADNKSKPEAEEYVDNLLDYHEVKDNKKDKIEDELLSQI